MPEVSWPRKQTTVATPDGQPLRCAGLTVEGGVAFTQDPGVRQAVVRLHPQNRYGKSSKSCVEIPADKLKELFAAMREAAEFADRAHAEQERARTPA